MWHFPGMQKKKQRNYSTTKQCLCCLKINFTLWKICTNSETKKFAYVETLKATLPLGSYVISLGNDGIVLVMLSNTPVCTCRCKSSFISSYAFPLSDISNMLTISFQKMLSIWEVCRLFVLTLQNSKESWHVTSFCSPKINVNFRQQGSNGSYF